PGMIAMADGFWHTSPMGSFVLKDLTLLGASLFLAVHYCQRVQQKSNLIPYSVVVHDDQAGSTAAGTPSRLAVGGELFVVESVSTRCARAGQSQLEHQEQ